MNIIVTGASRGIGREIVRKLAKEPSHKIIGIARSYERLKGLKESCQSDYGNDNVEIIKHDLKDLMNICPLIDEISGYFDHVDILINCLGYFQNKPFENTKISEARDIFDTNFFSVALLIRKLTPSLSEKSHVVNITSMGGVQGSAKFAGLSMYSASKAAVNVLTECLAEEYKTKKISFNALALGAVDTEMFHQAFPDKTAPVKPSEMAEFITDFALNGHRFFNGKILPVALSTP
jgi:short-subunit dehydrogenase